MAITAAGRDMRFDGSRCSFLLDGQRRAFDVVYSLGKRQNAGLAAALCAATNDEGALLVDHDLLTSVPGLYATGDVVSALNQIALATGHAAIVATHVHNNALPPNLA